RELQLPPGAQGPERPLGGLGHRPGHPQRRRRVPRGQRALDAVQRGAPPLQVLLLGMTTFSQTQPSLPAIIALARAGASVRARRLFRAAGLEAVDDDPAVLSVRGRLLKDEAQAATGAERSRLWRAAGDAYARASELGGA